MLLGTVADASLRCVASGEWERSGVRGGSSLRSSSATPPPGVAALSFPDDAAETGSLGGVVALVMLNVVAMVSEIHGGETALKLASVGGTRRCREGVRRTSGVGHSGGSHATQVVGRGIHGRRGQPRRSDSTVGVGRASSTRPSSWMPAVPGGRTEPVRLVVAGTVASGRCVEVAASSGGWLAAVVAPWRRS